MTLQTLPHSFSIKNDNAACVSAFTIGIRFLEIQIAFEIFACQTSALAGCNGFEGQGQPAHEWDGRFLGHYVICGGCGEVKKCKTNHPSGERKTK